MKYGFLIAGAAAGTVNGLFGAGGGMIFVPLLSVLTDIREEEIFPTSVATILPICAVSLVFRIGNVPESLLMGLPYLLGSIPGGIAAAFTGRYIPAKWLHRLLGIMILWGGVRILW